MKMPVKDPSKKTTTRKASEPNRCAFEASDGRRCRLPRAASHASLCVFHCREEQQLLESRKLGGELASTITGDFLTATDINYVLGKVFTAVAQNRMPVRTAHTLAYLGQIMLFSLPTVKREFDFVYKFEQWNNMLHKAVRLSDPPPELGYIPDAPSTEAIEEADASAPSDVPTES